MQIEDNRLSCGESYKIYESLEDRVFRSVDMASLSLRDLAGRNLPDVTEPGREADKSQSNELRNHVVASQWIAETAPRNPGTVG